MKNLMTPLMFSAAVMLSMTVFTVNAEPRAENSNGKAMAKLQAMVKEATTARDALKTEKEKLEQELTAAVNQLGIGPQGLGGDGTAFAVHVELAHTHITLNPVAVNMQCHSARRARATFTPDGVTYGF